MNSPESDFVDEIVQDKVPVHTGPPRGRFLPWHKVRKEYIRRFQWSELAVRMIKRSWQRQLQTEESTWALDDQPGSGERFEPPANLRLERPLSCLVIPGEDLLDMRALWRDVNHLNCFIRYLGFNESQGSELVGTRVHVANNAVTSLPRVASNSRVLQDRFEAIAKENSQAYRYLKEYGPFHIVNLDLCGSMFPNTSKDPQEYYEALLRLLAYQFEHQKTEWLLFIVTMVEPGVVDVKRLQALCGPTRQNMENHRDFAERMVGLLPAEALRDPTSPVNLSLLAGEHLIRLFGIALGKWLLALCQKARPQWTVAMRRSFQYSQNKQQGAVMLSLAFELKPNVTPPVDTTGMTKLQLATKAYPSERDCAVKLAESVGNIRDVDAELTANKAMWAELRDAQADLLESAGYDREAYLKWVGSGELIPADLL
jgi:hypothetical protein